MTKIAPDGGGDVIQVTPEVLEAFAGKFYQAANDEAQQLQGLGHSGKELRDQILTLYGAQSKSAISFDQLWGLWMEAMLALNETLNTMGNLLTWAGQHYDTNEKVTLDQFRPENQPATPGRSGNHPF